MEADFTRSKKTTDPLKIATRVLLGERGYTTREIDYGLGFYRDGLNLTGTRIRGMAVGCASQIELRRDKLRLGTELYQGKAYFWAYKYRFWMRGDGHGNGYKGISIERARRIIHQRFLEEGLSLDGETQKHDEIINEVFTVHRKPIAGFMVINYYQEDEDDKEFDDSDVDCFYNDEEGGA